MPQTTPKTAAIGSLVVIAAVVGGAAAAFAYTAGWFSPERLGPGRFVAALAPPGGPALGHRRNHAKGLCFTGRFEANGAGSALSAAPMLAKGSYPVVGRFNLGTPDPMAVDGVVRVRGIGLQVTAPDGQHWRMAMIDLPFFPVATPDAFYELLVASGQKDNPDAMKAFAARHPEIGAFGAWAKSAPFTESYAEERYNGLNSFVFTDAQGADHVVRWSLLPAASVVTVPADDLAKRPADFLEQDITQRVAAGPQRWTMAVQAANPSDPVADPSKAWPDDRRTMEVGTLVADKVIAEPDGPCRDINFDPAVLPSGMRTSADPFPAARSAVYAVSYDRRTAEAADYPPHGTGSAAMSGVARHFTVTQRALHWLMAVAILAMLFIGIGMVSTVMPDYLTLVSIHRPLGIAILILALLRLAVRLSAGSPGLPADLPAPMKLAARLSHFALYALMIAMPLLGWAMLSAAAYPAVMIGGWSLPAIVPQSDSLHTALWNAHRTLAFVFFA